MKKSRGLKAYPNRQVVRGKAGVKQLSQSKDNQQSATSRSSNYATGEDADTELMIEFDHEPSHACSLYIRPQCLAILSSPRALLSYALATQPRRRASSSAMPTMTCAILRAQGDAASDGPPPLLVRLTR